MDFFFVDYKGKKNATALKTFDRWELGREHIALTALHFLTSAIFLLKLKKKIK
jgi:hypothetical protein